jgi:serine/threonine-protein kinase
VAAKLFDPGAGRQRVDRYELIGEIASGGMATVYLARLTGVGGFQRFVAMKRLHPHLANEKEFVEMFLDEARLSAGIHHPNVVPILEVGASPVGYYLVMEYVEGDTLARLLSRAANRGRRIPPGVTLRVALDMLAGLHAAHELRDDAGQPVNLVHRDVSPQNVLVGTDGIARITDFGVARAASRLSATRVGQLKGKIAYMAPEHAQGDEDIDRRADVFSSGVVIWEAFAARRLFKADHEAATLTRVISDPIPDLLALAPHAGAEVCSVVMRALDRDRQRRFASCAQFADALEAAAQARQKIASSRELAAYVQEVLGEEIARQRDEVRVWIARTDSDRDASFPSNPAAAPSSSVSASSFTVPDGPLSRSQATVPDAPRRSRALRALVLVSLLALVGGGGFYAAHFFGQGAGAAAASVAAPPVVSELAREQPAPAPAEPVKATEPSSALSAEAALAPPPSAAVVETSKAVASSAPPRPARAAHAPVKRPRKKGKEDVPNNPYR